jgi:hypothetical protein
MFPRTGFLGHRTWQGSFPSAGAALRLPLAQPPKQLREADLQDVGDLAAVFTGMLIRPRSSGLTSARRIPTLGSLAMIAWTLKIMMSKLLEGVDWSSIFITLELRTRLR